MVMEITFSCSIEDYISYSNWVATRNKSIFTQGWERLCVSFCSMACPLFCSLLTRDYRENQAVWKIFAAWAGVMFVANLLLFQPEKKRLEKWIRAAYRGGGECGHFCTKTVRLLDGSVWLKTDSGETTFSYRGVTGIIETPTHLVIKRGPEAYIIPRSKIESGDLAEFLAHLRAHILTAGAQLEPEITDLRGRPIGKFDAVARLVAIILTGVASAWAILVFTLMAAHDFLRDTRLGFLVATIDRLAQFPSQTTFDIAPLGLAFGWVLPGLIATMIFTKLRGHKF
jgi:hypothetical protein